MSWWILLLAGAAIVQLADVVSTVIALRRGWGEGNPIVRGIMRVAGPWGWPVFVIM